MLLRTSFLLVCLSIASAVSLEADHKSVVGAAYFLTDDPSGNKIVSTNIATDGKLGPAVNAISTGGRGAHGITVPIGTDPLFSQGAVKVNANANILVTVNPGSNTVAMFKIDPHNPASLTMIGRPVSSNGEFPISVAINSEGNIACVLNGGRVSGINCYTAHPIFGLISKPNTFRSLELNQTTPPSGPPGSASHIIFSADDSRVMASVKGIPPKPGFIASWAITADGSLSAEPVKSTPASGGLLPFSMTLIPGTHGVLSTDPGIGFEIYDFGLGQNFKASSSVVSIPGQKATCWSTYSSKSGNFYLIDAGTATITEVHVDGNLKGKIVKQYPQVAGSATLDPDIATIGNSNYLYVLAANTASINVLNVNTPGKATTIQNFNFASAAKAAGIEFDELNLQGMATFVNY